MPRRPLPDSRKRLEEQERRQDSRVGTIAAILLLLALLLLALAYLYL